MDEHEAEEKSELLDRLMSFNHYDSMIMEDDETTKRQENDPDGVKTRTDRSINNTLMNDDIAMDDNARRTHNEKGNKIFDSDDATYIKLILKYPKFRLLLCSFIITYIGEWLTYIASLSLIEHILTEQNQDQEDDTTNRTAISILVVVRFLPFFLISPFGGVLADGRDRRHSMILLDIVAGCTVLGFILAKYLQSILCIYIVSFIQWAIAGLYEPCRSSIIPMLVPDRRYLKKAMTLSGILWSTLKAIGSATGGVLVASVGFDGCFIIDSMTYILSAFLLWLIGGNWNPDGDNDENESSSSKETNTIKRSQQSLIHTTIIYLWDKIKRMVMDGIRYVYGSFWGSLVLLKATGALIWGAMDVLNVSFAEEGSGADNVAVVSSQRLGYIFAFAGIGCLIGPLLADQMTSMEFPYTIQRACVVGIVFGTCGCVAIGLVANKSFWSLLLFTSVRTMGSSAVWIYSSLLLQKFSSIEMLGRVSAIDTGLSLLSQSVTAYVFGGYFQDNLHLSASFISTVVLGGIGVVVSSCWILYHMNGKGAANTSQAKLLERKRMEKNARKRGEDDKEDSSFDG